MTFSPNPAKPRALLTHCPAYQATPLQHLTSHGGVTIIAKDETQRMGLGSFKALGGVYAVAALLIQAHEQKTGQAVDPSSLTSDAFKAFAADYTFVCASAGNHAMAVAAGANIFGAKSRIHLARSVPESFADRLRAKNAEAIWSGDVYEESMKAASEDAETTGAILLADGSWPGYTEPPSLVMEGYTVMAEEMREAFEQSGEWPTHVFLQAGVGGLAAAIAHMIRENWTEQPEITIVEPTAAPCLLESNKQGVFAQVKGPVSNMGRLDCKEPSIVALDSLNKTATHFVAISDEEAIVGQDYSDANGIPSTPSGAAGLGGLLAGERLDLKLPKGSRALVIISEGQV